MNKLFTSSLLIHLLLSSYSLAANQLVKSKTGFQVGAPIQKDLKSEDDALFECSDSVCEYKLRNTSSLGASNLIRTVMLKVDPQSQGMFSSDGTTWIMINPKNDSAIMFYSENADLLKKIKLNVINSDRVNEFANYGGDVFLKMSVLEMTADDAKRLAHEFSALTYRKGLSQLKPENTGSSVDTAGGVTHSILSIGNLVSSILRVKLDFTKSFDISKAETSIQVPLKNGDSFSISNSDSYRQKDNYNAQTSQLGLFANGRLNYDMANNIIRLSNVSGSYSFLPSETPTQPELIAISKSISFSLGNLDLKPGVPAIVVLRNQSKSELTQMKNGILASNDGKGQQEKQLMILLTATPIQVDELGNKVLTNFDNLVDESANANLGTVSNRIQQALNQIYFEGQWVGYNSLYGQKVYLKLPESILTKQNKDLRLRINIRDNYESNNFRSDKSLDTGEFVIAKIADLATGPGVELKISPLRKDCRELTEKCSIVNWTVDVAPYQIRSAMKNPTNEVASDLTKNANKDLESSKSLKKNFSVNLLVQPAKSYNLILDSSQILQQKPDIEWEEQ